MEDSFSVRVDKAFGSLALSSASLSSLWCLEDDEIRRNEWNRDKEASEPANTPRPGPFRSNSFLDGLSKEKESADVRAQLEKDLDDLDVDDGWDQEEEEEEDWRSGVSSSRWQNEEEREIKSSVGLDSTLDFEEEEDQNDKVAIGYERMGGRLYTKGVNTDYVTEADEWNELPTSFKDLARDPRANHFAAKLRLREDAKAAEKMDGLRVSEDKANHSLSLSMSQNIDAEHQTGAEAFFSSSEDCSLRSILKRKDYQVDSVSHKRVRFSSECCGDDDLKEEGDGGNKNSAVEASSAGREDVSNLEYKLPPDYYPLGIPDYLRNPWKYTRYTLDSAEVNEGSNRKAYLDFLNMLNSRGNSKFLLKEDVDAPIDLPKTVAFVPKKKPSNISMFGNELGRNSRSSRMVSEGKKAVLVPPSIATIHSADEDEDEACPMEEDASQTKTDDVNVNVVRRGVQIPGRQYRAKPKEDPD